MTTDPTNDPTLDATENATPESFREPVADRPPTEDEARAAERAAAGVDVDEVAEHYEEMAELGADVQGEGQIEPDA